MLFLQVHANFATITKSCVITSNDISCFTCVTSHMLPSSSILHYTLPHFNAGINITIMYQLYKAHSNVHRSNSLTLHATLHFNLSYIIHLASSFLFYIFFYHFLWLIHRGREEGHTFHLSRFTCVLFANCVASIKIL